MFLQGVWVFQPTHEDFYTTFAICQVLLSYLSLSFCNRNRVIEVDNVRSSWYTGIVREREVIEMAGSVLFPDVQVRLVGEDGNAFAILGRVQKALKRGGASAEQVSEFLKEAMSGDYDNLLQVVMRWVEVE
jgi:hypothetical protein